MLLSPQLKPTSIIVSCQVASLQAYLHAIFLSPHTVMPDYRVIPADVEKVGDSFCLMGQPDAKVIQAAGFPQRVF